MLTQDYLSLRLVRLKPAEEWSNPGAGLSFVFPRGGAGRFVSGKVTQRLAPGDVLVLDGAPGGKLSVLDRGEMVFWCFSVCRENLFPLFAGNEICLLQGILDEFKPIKFYPASGPLARECHRLLGDVSPQFNLDHRGQLVRVAAAILSAEFKDAHSHRVGFVRVKEHMIQVFEKLSTAELLNSSVGELADRFGCSRRHLNRLFHHHLGLSVATLRMEMRLSKAVSLLRDPDSKVIRVAEECGFHHLGLFNTCFKRRFGVSPGQWRKKPLPALGLSGNLAVSEAACPMRINGLCPWIVNNANQDQAVPAAPRTQETAPTEPEKSIAPVEQNLSSPVTVDQRQIRKSLYRPKTFQASS